jgi:hypothetical protein
LTFQTSVPWLKLITWFKCLSSCLQFLQSLLDYNNISMLNNFYAKSMAKELLTHNSSHWTSSQDHLAYFYSIFSTILSEKISTLQLQEPGCWLWNLWSFVIFQVKRNSLKPAREGDISKVQESLNLGTEHIMLFNCTSWKFCLM